MMLTLRGGLLVVVVVFNKPLAFFSAKMRVGHLVCLTALQSAHRWTVEKRNTESE